MNTNVAVQNTLSSVDYVHCRPSLPGVVVLIVLAIVIVSVIVVVPWDGGEETADVDEVEDDPEEDAGPEQGEGGGGAAGVEVQEPCLPAVHELGLVELLGHRRTHQQCHDQRLSDHPGKEYTAEHMMPGLLGFPLYNQGLDKYNCIQFRAHVSLGVIYSSSV